MSVEKKKKYALSTLNGSAWLGSAIYYILYNLNLSKFSSSFFVDFYNKPPKNSFEQNQ